MKKVSKIILVISIILAFVIAPQLSFAVSDNIADWNFKANQTVPTQITDIGGLIIRVLRNVSVMITVVVITILGIKYMIGSVQERAEYKKGYINIIIGVVLITMVTSIIDVIFTAAQN